MASVRLHTRQRPPGVDITFVADSSASLAVSRAGATTRGNVRDLSQRAAQDALEAMRIRDVDWWPAECPTTCSHGHQVHAHVVVANHPARIHGVCRAAVQAFAGARTLREAYAAALDHRLQELRDA